MADSPATTPGSRKARSESAAIALILSMADTTWRMFVPTVGLLLAGHSLDNRLDTNPWLMVLGLVLGAVIAGWLVVTQLKRGETN